MPICLLQRSATKSTTALGRSVTKMRNPSILKSSCSTEVAGKVFKIVHDKQRGALTLVRILRGEIKRGMRLISARGQAEVVSKLYEPLADEYREVSAVQSGDVVICAGLKVNYTK